MNIGSNSPGLLVPGDKRLRERSEDVNPNSEALPHLVMALWATMHKHGFVSLSAPQFNVPARVFVIGYGVPKAEILAMINPVIVKVGGEQTSYEGCCSVEKKDGAQKVKRSLRLKVEYTDLKGARVRLKTHGRMAAIIQHEIDHLNGILFTDISQPVYSKPVMRLTPEQLTQAKEFFAKRNAEALIVLDDKEAVAP